MQREMFAKILGAIDLKKPNMLAIGKQESRVGGMESASGDAQDIIRKLHERISELEQKNGSLKELVESLKSTFDFFEIANDQYILQRH
jgi:peptidoglycan hydrolase CwlO-like protein